MDLLLSNLDVHSDLSLGLIPPPELSKAPVGISVYFNDGTRWGTTGVSKSALLNLCFNKFINDLDKITEIKLSE